MMMNNVFYNAVGCALLKTTLFLAKWIFSILLGLSVLYIPYGIGSTILIFSMLSIYYALKVNFINKKDKLWTNLVNLFKDEKSQSYIFLGLLNLLISSPINFMFQYYALLANRTGQILISLFSILLTLYLSFFISLLLLICTCLLTSVKNKYLEFLENCKLKNKN